MRSQEETKRGGGEKNNLADNYMALGEINGFETIRNEQFLAYLGHARQLKFENTLIDNITKDP